MATNQVIHGSNRVVENPNRYKLNAVSGQANTYDLEKIPGTITDNGTPYNKIILDKIDNVLSYLTPSVEKIGEEIENHETISATNITASSTVPVTTYDGIELESLVANYNNISTAASLIPKLQISTNSNFKIGPTGSLGYYRQLSFVYASSEKYTSDYLISFLNFKQQTSGSYLRFQLNGTDYFDFVFDVGFICDFKYNAYISPSSGIKFDIYTSIDNIVWTKYQSYSSSWEGNINFTNVRYVKLHAYSSNSSYKNCTIYYMYISNINGLYSYPSIVYSNKFALDNNLDFSNNQRVLLGMPINPTINNIKTIPNENSQTRNTTYTGTTNGIFTDGTSPTIEYNLSYVYSNSRLSNWTKSNMSNVLNLTARNDNRYLELSTNSFFEIDLKSARNFVLNYNAIYDNAKISNDGINWKSADYEILETYKHSIKANARYIRFSDTNNLFFLYFESIDDIINLDMSDVVSNTLNEVDIDTLLQPSKYYELLYKQDTDKFIAEEVRNAN